MYGCEPGEDIRDGKENRVLSCGFLYRAPVNCAAYHPNKSVHNTFLEHDIDDRPAQEEYCSMCARGSSDSS